MSITISSSKPTVHSISPSNPSTNSSAGASQAKPADSTGHSVEKFSKLMEGLHVNGSPHFGIRGPLGGSPLHHSARLAVFQRVVNDGLRGGPFDLPQGPLRQGLVDAIAGELVNSHYKV